MYKLGLFLAIIALAGCAVGHKDFISYQDKSIGRAVVETMPYKWPDSGGLIRADFLLSGEGLIHINKDETGNLIYHYSVQEVLPHFQNKEWVGKCLIYEVVDPVTRVIKDWGFDKGGNPLSCRTWP